MRFVRRSQERKRDRETTVKDNISSGLKESIGYEILLRMGWSKDTGLGRNRDGRVSITGLIQTGKRPKVAGHELDYDKAVSEYNHLLKEAHTKEGTI
ncbi:hypothetical protein NEDG_00556 [Nematocida displodere]|uniref:G-patch domain-containing protein n=1 Tax=Nematocida displodere TaxID=1805483 RepID=A0A177EBU2_9MICR|nr:hypothetical protein NEDG_00556 [Nematocida displodere]